MNKDYVDSRPSSSDAIDNMKSEKALLIRIAQGDEKAFRQIFEKYQKKVFAYACHILKSDTLAEEVVYELFLMVWQHKSLDRIDAFEAYIQVATRNQTLKKLRKIRLQQKLNAQVMVNWDESRNTTEERILFNETQRILAEAIENLPPQQKKVYELCKTEGLRYEQVADRLALSRLTVKTHMQLALRYIRKYLVERTEIAVVVLLSYIIS